MDWPVLDSRFGDSSASANAVRNVALAEARVGSFNATLSAERLESKRDSPEWKDAAEKALAAQRKLAVLEGRIALQEAGAAMKTAQAKADKDAQGGDKGVAAKSAATLAAAQKALTAAGKALDKADKDLTAPITAAYAPNKFDLFPPTSTGRRLALAQWFANGKNPLTARVAVNHIWAHHFGRGLVDTPNDFGKMGSAPSHPELLDWLAVWFRDEAKGSLKALHQLIVTSETWKQQSAELGVGSAESKAQRRNSSNSTPVSYTHLTLPTTPYV